MYNTPMLARLALWVIAAVDLVVLIYHAIREWRLHPQFLQERMDHQVLVIGATTLLVAQIAAIGLALTRSRPRANILRKAGATVVLVGAALFNAASLFVLTIQFWDFGTVGRTSMPALDLAIFIVWALANVFGFAASLRRRPWAATPLATQQRGSSSRQQASRVGE